MDLETAQRIERLEYLVEMLCRHQGLAAGQLLGRDSALPPIFCEYVRTGKKIQAINVFPEVTGAGLKESKDFVDRIPRR